MTTSAHDPAPGGGADSAADTDLDAGTPLGVAQCVSALWREALNADEVGLDDDFFDLGGNSISAVRLVPMLSERLGVDVTMSVIFDHPTPRELGKKLHTLGTGVPGKSEGA
ncbi:MAG: acyl carrier protein [Actinobacteria bacterium]|nr:acyl carrier protein [Actinomycetota bacterium]